MGLFFEHVSKRPLFLARAEYSDFLFFNKIVYIESTMLIIYEPLSLFDLILNK